MKLLNNSGGLKLATFPWVCSCPAQLWPASFRLSEPLRGRVRWLVMSTTSEIGLISQNTNKYGWTRCEYQLLLETGRIGWLVRWSKDLHQLKLPHSFPYYFEVKNFKVSPHLWNSTLESSRVTEIRRETPLSISILINGLFHARLAYSWRRRNCSVPAKITEIITEMLKIRN